MKIMNIFNILIISIGVTAIRADVDCSKRPPHLHLHSCCELSNLISEELKEKCGGQDLDMNFRPHHGHPHGPPGVRGGPHKFGSHKNCFLSCVVNETGILVDGELQEIELSAYLDKLFGDNEKIEFLTNKFKVCHEEQKDLESKWPEHRNGPHHCHLKGNGMVMGCVRMQAFKDCPDAFWLNTDECNEVRDHFNQCSPFFKNQGNEEKLGVEDEQDI